jgi:predicted alpha/beta-hydrolase family hydrolase
MKPFVDGLRARGIDATAIDLPKRKAEEAIPAFHLVVPSAPDIAVGGHSYGGRVASLAAAEPDAPYAALVLFSYPLHPPGRPENTEARIAHWPSIRCPVLLLSGEADPFARIELLRTAVPLLANAELHTYPKLGHTLKPVLNDALNRTAAFLERAAVPAK